MEGFICLPLSPFICLPLSPSLDAWHGSLGRRVHLSPFVSLHLSAVASQPGCLARLSGWTGSFVSLCLPSFVWHGSLGFVSLHLSPVVSQPGCLARPPGGQIHLSPFVSLHLSPVVSQPQCLARLFGWTVSLVSLCLPSFGSRCLPAWMSVTALQADGFTCLPWFPFICLPSLWVDGLICLPLSPSPVVSQPGCLSGWTDSFVSLCLPLFVSRCLPAWMPLWVDGFICLPLSPLAPGIVPALPADGFLSLHLPDRFICLPLSPFIWPGCLPAWMPVTAPWVDGFVCLPAWMSGTALRADVFICLPLSPSCCPPAWMPGTAPWSFAVYSAGTHVCLRLRNVCLSARVRLIKPQAACCGCTYECFK